MRARRASTQPTSSRGDRGGSRLRLRVTPCSLTRDFDPRASLGDGITAESPPRGIQSRRRRRTCFSPAALRKANSETNNRRRDKNFDISYILYGEICPWIETRISIFRSHSEISPAIRCYRNCIRKLRYLVHYSEISL